MLCVSQFITDASIKLQWLYNSCSYRYSHMQCCIDKSKHMCYM